MSIHPRHFRSYCIVLLTFASLTARSQTAIFDQEAAWQYLLKQCEFGPRAPGTPGHKACLDYLQTELKKYSSSVKLQDFIGRNPVSGESYSLSNVTAAFWPERNRRVLLCAHWDTRPWADRDPDSDNRDTPIIGANDGASGVAVLLEICRQLAQADPGIGVDIVFFDGEDMGRAGNLDEYCLGSKWYARQVRYPRPEAAVLLDMIGDEDLHVPQELYSLMNAPDLLNSIYSTAAQLGEAAFDSGPGSPVYDDHVALLQEGIPAVNLIDFDYPYWHTVEDTPGHCSAESLGTVGRVLLAWLFAYNHR